MRPQICRAARPLLGETTRSKLPPSIVASLASKRFMVGDTGDNNTGHITTAPQQGIIFMDSILPPNLSWLMRLTSHFGGYSGFTKKLDPTMGRYGTINPQTVFQKAIKHANLGKAEVLEILPRYAESAAFLKFSHDGTSDSKSIAVAVSKYLEENKARPWWNPFTYVRASYVLGKPWLEDLSRTPSPRIRVEFLPTEPGAEAAELGQEQLYSFFRPFGKLSDIVVQPSDSKVVPRYAYLDFTHHQKAIMAKNCMHGYLVSDAEGGGKNGTILRLTYEKKQRAGWIKDWIMNHPRIVLPLIVALIAGISYTIFDPLRTISIKAHITRAFHLEENAFFAWFIRQGEDLYNKVKYFGSDANRGDGGMQVVWDDRQSEIQQIQAWLMESADTFIVVQGPRGSGKRELVIEHALKHKREAHRVLVVDCKPIQESRGDAPTIAAAAAQVGYRPVFSWVNNISGLMGLAAQGMTGTKAGFSETLENQLIKIWSKTTVALKSIALDGRSRDGKDARMSDDEYLESHPERRPVVVIENFLHKSSEPGAALVYDKLAEWAATLTTSNIAHVIFLTNDVSFSKSLSKALPDRVFRQISLGDCSPEVAKRYVISHLDFDADLHKIKGGPDDESKPLTPSQKREDLRELDNVIGYLGGRLTDLEFFARRIKAGETPSKAVQEIVDQSASEILKMFLLLDSDSREWTSSQAWLLVRDLASSEVLRYNETLTKLPFNNPSSGEKALQALEQAELITIQSCNGRPSSIKPGKPVYQPAFQKLLHDNVLRARMELASLTEAISNENKSIEKFEAELQILSPRPPPRELWQRIQWLLGKIDTSQKKIIEYEKSLAEMKRILNEEF
ncbi:hypothetical protein AC579_1158 [Pseudocercospora musae]|uniref:Mitochondrial escape protein 2 n=1 Tax=Pseudocercospora musae TaxID=113226 RepID=A0A139I312_9PEZI|nr:hypothetical protein AC579_1158 [Pseudocercospora musae]